METFFGTFPDHLEAFLYSCFTFLGAIEGEIATCDKSCNDYVVEGAKLTPIDGNSGWLFFEVNHVIWNYRIKCSHSAGKRDRDLTPSPILCSMARRAESPVERAKRAVRANERSE